MLKKITLLGAAAASAFAMHSAEININDKDLELGGKIDMGQFNHTVDPDTVFLGARFLSADEDHSDNENVSLDPYYEVNFLMQNRISNTDLTLGLGVKLNYFTQDFSQNKLDFASIPLGIEAKYRLPLGNTVPVSLGGALYYAPEVLSMMDGEDYFEYRFTLDVEVIKNANVTLGYRNLEMGFEGAGDAFTYNKSAYVGFKFRF